MVGYAAAQDLWGMRCHDPTPSALLYVHRVVANTETCYQLQVRCLVQEPRVYGLGAHQYGNHALELVIVWTLDVLHIGVLLEDIRDIHRDVHGTCADQNFGFHTERDVRVG